MGGSSVAFGNVNGSTQVGIDLRGEVIAKAALSLQGLDCRSGYSALNFGAGPRGNTSLGVLGNGSGSYGSGLNPLLSLMASGAGLGSVSNANLGSLSQYVYLQQQQQQQQNHNGGLMGISGLSEILNMAANHKIQGLQGF